MADYLYLRSKLLNKLTLLTPSYNEQGIQISFNG